MHVYQSAEKVVHTFVLQVRKLEFLLADALNGGHDSVITIGGIQVSCCC